MDPGMDLLTTLGEVGGITGMMLAAVLFVVRVLRRNRCAMKCYSCSGQPLAVLDVEEAAAEPPAASKPPTAATAPHHIEID